MATVGPAEDEESPAVTVVAPPPRWSLRSTSKLSVARGVTVAYRVSLSVEVKVKTDSGKASGATEQKLVVDDARGAVAPGQVRKRQNKGPEQPPPVVVRVLVWAFYVVWGCLACPLPPLPPFFFWVGGSSI